VRIDHRIVEREYQTDCIEVLTGEFHRGRCKILVEMATGTGKTRTAAAFIKRLFEANTVTRVLFLVDRNTLAKLFGSFVALLVVGYQIARTRPVPR
jgi:type I restriction enzyme, R subunit